MKRNVPIIAVICFLSIYSKAQTYIVPMIGSQVDLNNNTKFKQYNLGLQLSVKIARQYKIAFYLQQSMPFVYTSSDSAFASNINLPIYSSAKKNIKPYTTSFFVGHHIKISGKYSNNSLFIILGTGISNQRVVVNYTYDKNNYVILNPDRSFDKFGLYFSGGVEYMRQLKSGYYTLQLTATTPQIGERIKYPLSYKFLAPLALNFGYAILLKKK